MLPSEFGWQLHKQTSIPALASWYISILTDTRKWLIQGHITNKCRRLSFKPTSDSKARVLTTMLPNPDHLCEGQQIKGDAHEAAAALQRLDAERRPAQKDRIPRTLGRKNVRSFPTSLKVLPHPFKFSLKEL